ncbi:class IV adenylate cyclase [Haloarchaeobius iranensis]|uniref:Adenylate cyclase n=1 Tax=Haloarchaeobius iranensis TaxID=996166 RepID=A0A1G9YUB2_9EURY|nr:class IV adenylate cyclase [Haloarchaeobius iranensis]SDN12732.1 adenylate cyclase [Haloarchaeobius iranensis]
MYEVELKVRAGHDAVRRRLDEQDAEPVDAVGQTDVYYDAPHRDFAATDEALRIRQEVPLDEVEGDDAGFDWPAGEGTTMVTYKGPLVDDRSKTREEFETAVADRDAMEGLLDGLGFEPAATVRKRRRRFALSGYTVTLDEVAGLGEFVEVETEVESDDIEDARDGAVAVLESLGLDSADGIRTSYLGLLLDS